MKSVYIENPPEIHHAEPLVTRIDDKRGTFGMLLFITTEAALFVVLFFAYFYVEKGQPQRWSLEEPPKLHYSLPMLGVLLLSSAVLYWGEQSVKKEQHRRGLIAVLGTLFLGIVFLVLTYFEYSEHLLHLTPRSNAYGSIFYMITSLHLAHLILGMLMLTWVALLPRWEPSVLPPYRPYHNAALYWHFVDTVWLFVVAILYVAPNIYVKL